jgi:hypothetical protein
MSSKFFGNRNEKKPLTTKGVKTTQPKSQVRKTGRGK